MSNTPKRSPLGIFLRARREELGLSREDLVSRILLRTGYRLSACHCYRIEQGVRMPSADALDKIADGLDLDRAERVYVHSLIVEKPRPAPVTLRETVPEAVRRVVQSQQPASAHVTDRRMDILAWNDTFCEIYGFDFDAPQDEKERNVAWLVFNSPTVLERLRNWEIHAQTIVAFCRNLWAGHEKDKEIQDILQRMLTFPQFATWWNQPRVAIRYNFRKEIDHPNVGLLVLEQTAYQICDSPNLYMTLLSPLPECDTENKLRALLRRRRQHRGD